MKKQFDPTNAAFPLPVILVTCCSSKGDDNIITIAWTTNICKTPPHLGIVIGGEKYSAKLIRETKEFVVNIPDTKLLEDVDFCGETQGDKIDKFDRTGLTGSSAMLVKPKIINECPINMECRLKNTFTVESGNIFIGEILKTHIDEEILGRDGKILYSKLEPIIYAEKKYFSMKDIIGHRGFSQK